MRIPYFKRLDQVEKELYKSIMIRMKFENINCWDIKTPDDFENHKPCEDSKNW